MANYIGLTNGRLTEVAGQVTSAGAADAGKIPALDANGRLSSTLMPTGVGADTASILASENLASGDVVNVWSNAGAPNVRKADATTVGREACGFVVEAVTMGQNAEVYSDGSIPGLTGLTPGARYYLSTTPGQVTSTPPSASGNVLQFVGVAYSTTVLSFEPGDLCVTRV